MISKVTLRTMLGYLDMDVDAVHRVMTEMTRDDALDTVWTLLALLFPEVDGHDGRAAWGAQLEHLIAGQRIAGVPDYLPDFGER